MKLTIVDPSTLSLTDMMNGMSELYFLHVEDALSKPVLTPMGLGSLNILNDDSLLVRVVLGEEMEENEEIPVVEEKPKRAYGNRYTTSLTYKLNSNDPTESIFVNFSPGNSGIRVNFKDKESAQAYFEYFREQFYTRTTGASVITVSNIYKDLNVVNWNPEDCDDWGWYTIDYGPCRHISEVKKTKNTKLWGFTLSKPKKLYETKKREE